MAVATPAKNTPLLELKSASLTLVAVVMRSPDLALLAQDLAEREAVTPGLFDKDPAAIDLWRVREAEEPIDFVALIALLRSHSLVPVAARGGNPEQMAAAAAVGLAEAPDAPRSGTREPAVPMLTETLREVQLPPPAPSCSCAAARSARRNRSALRPHARATGRSLQGPCRTSPV